MMTDNISIPNIRFDGNTLVSDKCIWCDNAGRMSESHLIPKFLGGWFKPFISCKDCNNFLGRKIEIEAKKNSFITAAMVKLGLDSEQEAYRHLEKIDEETGAKMNFKNGNIAIPKIQWSKDKKELFAFPEESKKIRIAGFKKERPNWPTQPLEEFFDDPSRSKFKYAGKIYSKIDFPMKKATIKIKGKRDPHPFFIFKMVYEFLCMNNFLVVPTMVSYLKQFIHVDDNDTSNRINIDNSVSKYIISNTSNSFRHVKNFEKEIPFHPVHYFVFRLTNEMIFYVEVVLFGQLRNFFIIGLWEKKYEYWMNLIDKPHLFPVGGACNEPIVVYPNIKMKDHLTWVDAAIKIRLYQLNKGGESSDLSA